MKRTLKSIRADMGCTQKEMAEKLGISLVAYNKKEKGKSPLLAKELLLISKLSAIPCEDIILPV